MECWHRVRGQCQCQCQCGPHVLLVQCDYDGSHSSVQCGEGECHCHAPSGATLGTFAVDVTSRGDMSCGCARDTAADLTDLLCDGNGDYKQLQMRGEQEFCVQPRDGWRVGQG